MRYCVEIIIAACRAFAAIFFVTAANAQVSDVSRLSAAGGAYALPVFAGDLLNTAPRIFAPGIRMGSFTVSPSVAAAVHYDDNILASSAAQTADTYVTLEPELRAASNWSRHALELHARGGGIFHNEHESENRGFVNVGASGVLEARRDLWIRAFGAYGLQQEPRGTGESFPLYEAPVEVQSFTGGALLHKSFNRLWIELGGTARHDDYSDATLAGADGASIVDQDFRDGYVTEVFARAGYEVSPKTALFIEGSANARDYGGATFDSEGVKALAGVRYEFTRLLHGEAAAGALHQDASPGRRELDTYAWRAQLTWQPTRLVSVALIGNRDLGSPSRFAASSNRLVSEAAVRIDYAISRDLTLTGGAAFTRADFIDLDRPDDFVRVLGGAEMRLSDEVSLFAAYAFTGYGANAEPDVDYSRNVFSIGLRARR